MTPAPGGFDCDLQMFRDQVREPNLATLRFLRWLAERDRLEHEVCGPPGGSPAAPRPRQTKAARLRARP